MKDVKETLRQFISASYLPGEPLDDLRYDTPLQTSGILDSLAALELAAFVQQEFGIELDVYDTSVERFDRIDQIAEVVARKHEAAAHRRAS